MPVNQFHRKSDAAQPIISKGQSHITDIDDTRCFSMKDLTKIAVKIYAWHSEF